MLKTDLPITNDHNKLKIITIEQNVNDYSNNII